MKRLTALATSTAAVAFANGDAAPAAAKASKPRVAPVITGTHKIEIPQRSTKRGSVSLYPFDTLTEPGMAFGLKDRTAKNLSSIISNANRKGLVNKTDDAGNVVYKTKEITDAGGNKSVVPTTDPEKVAGQKFSAFDVTPEYAKTIKGTPLEGSSVIVVREI